MGRAIKARKAKRKMPGIVVIAGCVVVLLAVVGGILWWRVPVLEIRHADTGRSQVLSLADERRFVLAWVETAGDGDELRKHMSVEAHGDGTFGIINDSRAHVACPFTINDDTIKVFIAGDAEPTLIYAGGQIVLSNWFPQGADVVIRYRMLPAVMMMGRG